MAEFPLAKERARVRAWVDARLKELPREYPTPEHVRRHIELMDPAGDPVVGPRDLAHIEQLRLECGGAAGAGPGVPVDVMVWADGEPRHPAATKVGGTPYRPRRAEWPGDGEGEPSQFLGQICFADSRDVLTDSSGHVVELPGDVLLLFNTQLGGVFDSDDEDPKAIRYEWQQLGIEDLATAESVPVGEKRYDWIQPCHAQLHRTMEFPEAPEGHALRRVNDRDLLCVLEGGKIGGVPRFVQGETGRPGVFLGCLGSINPVGLEYPLLNVPTNPQGDFNLGGKFLQFGDCGILNLYLDRMDATSRRFALRWSVQGY